MFPDLQDDGSDELEYEYEEGRNILSDAFLNVEKSDDDEESCTCSVLLFVAGIYNTLQLIKNGRGLCFISFLDLWEF